MKKSLKELWNKKKLDLKYGRIEQALALNEEITKRIKEEK